MIISKNNLVLISKSLSLVIRSIFILLLYKESLFEFLGLYSLVSSLSVVFTGIFGLEMHMICNREIAASKVKTSLSFPLYYHTLLVLYTTIITAVLCYVFVDSQWATILILTGSYYILAEFIRFFNFSGRIVFSANLNLIRDILVVATFIGYKINPIYFLPISTLQLVLILILLYNSNKLKLFNFNEWLTQTKSFWLFSKYFYLNVISRNVLAYTDRFLVLSVSGLEGLGKYTLLAYVNTSAVTLLNGSVVYTRIPLLLKNKITSSDFFKSTILKSYVLLLFIWLAFYLIFPYINLPVDGFNPLFILIFIFYGFATLFFGVFGQIIYAKGRDKYLVLTSILAATVTLISASLISNVYIHLCVTTLLLIIIGIHRYFVSNNKVSI